MNPISTQPSAFRRLIYPLFLGVLLLIPRGGIADLIEDRFANYEEGELLDQQDWVTEGYFQEAREYGKTMERGEIRMDSEKGTKVLVWKPGFAGVERSRFLKKFPQTFENKVEVSLEFRLGEGNSAVFYFEQVNVAVFALHFAYGRLSLLHPDSQEQMPVTQLDFREWHHFVCRFDFDKRTVDIFVDNEHLGEHPISDALSGFNRVNFFAGGESDEPALADLSIKSVQEFKQP